MAKRQTVKRKKVTPLSNAEQMALVREKLLDICEDSQEQVTVPNMVKTLQHFVCELAFDLSLIHI